MGLVCQGSLSLSGDLASARLNKTAMRFITGQVANVCLQTMRITNIRLTKELWNLRKHIVFFIQNISLPAGSERVTSIIANNLAEKGYDITILSICGNGTCYYPLNKKISIYTLIEQPDADNRKLFLKILCRLARFYKNNKADICIDVFAALSIYTLILKKFFKFKNISWEHFNYNINTGMNKLGRKLACRFSDQIITLTETDKKYYQDNNKINGKIDYIYNPSPYQVIRKIPEKDNFIISIGRLTYQKGFDRLVDIWADIEDKTGCYLYILGDGEEKNALQAKINNKGLKQVKLLGNIKNVEEYYKKALFYVSSARYEGLPMTMIEAQSFGLPVISMDFDTGPRDIISNGTDGYIITGKDMRTVKNLFSKKILELLNDKEKIKAVK